MLTSGGGTTYFSLSLSLASSRDDLFPRIHVGDRDVLRNNNTGRALLEGNRARQKNRRRRRQNGKESRTPRRSRRLTFEKTFLVVATTRRRLASNAVCFFLSFFLFFFFLFTPIPALRFSRPSLLLAPFHVPFSASFHSASSRERAQHPSFLFLPPPPSLSSILYFGLIPSIVLARSTTSLFSLVLFDRRRFSMRSRPSIHKNVCAFE